MLKNELKSIENEASLKLQSDIAKLEKYKIAYSSEKRLNEMLLEVASTSEREATRNETEAVLNSQGIYTGDKFGLQYNKIIQEDSGINGDVIKETMPPFMNEINSLTGASFAHYSFGLVIDVQNNPGNIRVFSAKIHEMLSDLYSLVENKKERNLHYEYIINVLMMLLVELKLAIRQTDEAWLLDEYSSKKLTWDVLYARLASFYKLDFSLKDQQEFEIGYLGDINTRPLDEIIAFKLALYQARKKCTSNSEKAVYVIKELTKKRYGVNHACRKYNCLFSMTLDYLGIKLETDFL